MVTFIRVAAMLPIFAMFSGVGAKAAAQNLPELGVFLTGRLVAEGKFSDYVAGSTRGLRVNISGVSRGSTLNLVEDMVYSDGEKRKYVWKFTQVNGEYVGQRPDLIGKAKVTQNADAIEISYRANIILPDGKEQVLDFVEVLTFKSEDSAKFKIKVSKFFIPVADADLTIKKLAASQ
jgi:hypothetical protein